MGVTCTSLQYVLFQVLPYIDGFNHVAKIAAAVDVKNNLVKACVQNITSGAITLGKKCHTKAVFVIRQYCHQMAFSFHFTNNQFIRRLFPSLLPSQFTLLPLLFVSRPRLSTAKNPPHHTESHTHTHWTLFSSRTRTLLPFPPDSTAGYFLFFLVLSHFVSRAF